MSNSDNFAKRYLGGLIQIIFICAPKKYRDDLAKIGKETDDFF